MLRMRGNAYRIKRVGAVLALFLSVAVRAADLGALPFDHRRLLLVQMDKTQVPSEKVLAHILDEMRIRGRCQWVLASQPGNPITPVMVPRDFSWDSAPSVQKMAEKYGVDGLVWLQQRDQEILLKWYDGKEGLPLVFDSVYLREGGKNTERVAQWIASIWAKFPGVGFVAKRDAKFVYFEGSEETALKPGGLVSVLRVESVTRHQLFKTLADFKASLVGKARVVSVDKLLAKAEVLEESPLDPIRMGDRYQIEATVAPEAAAVGVDAKAPAPIAQDSGVVEMIGGGGLGSIAFSGAYGSLTHAEQTTDGQNPQLKRNAPGFELEAMGHVTSRWVGWMNYRYRFAAFAKPGALFNNESYLNARFNSLAFLVGYRFFFSGMESEVGVETARANDLWIAPFAGYRGYSFTAGDQTLNYGPTTKKWNSLSFGVQMRFPFGDDWHARIVGAKSMFLAFRETDEESGGNASPSAAEIAASLFVNTSDSSAVGLGFRYQTLSATYDGAGTRGVSATKVDVSVSELMLTYEAKF